MTLSILRSDSFSICCPSPFFVAIEIAIDCAMQNTRDVVARPSSNVHFRKMKYFVPRRVKTLKIAVTSMNQVKTLIAGVQVFFNSGDMATGFKKDTQQKRLEPCASGHLGSYRMYNTLSSTSRIFVGPAGPNNVS